MVKKAYKLSSQFYILGSRTYGDPSLSDVSLGTRSPESLVASDRGQENQ